MDVERASQQRRDAELGGERVEVLAQRRRYGDAMREAVEAARAVAVKGVDNSANIGECPALRN